MKPSHSCVNTVQNVLKSVEGVKPISVSIGSADVEVGPFILPQVVVEAIESVGFDAKILQQLLPVGSGRKKSVEIGIKVEGIKTKKEANRLLNLLR